MCSCNISTSSCIPLQDCSSQALCYITYRSLTTIDPPSFLPSFLPSHKPHLPCLVDKKTTPRYILHCLDTKPSSYHTIPYLPSTHSPPQYFSCSSSFLSHTTTTTTPTILTTSFQRTHLPQNPHHPGARFRASDFRPPRLATDRGLNRYLEI